MASKKRISLEGKTVLVLTTDVRSEGGYEAAIEAATTARNATDLLVVVLDKDDKFDALSDADLEQAGLVRIAALEGALNERLGRNAETQE